MLPPDEHPTLIDNEGHEVILLEHGQELIGEGHFVANQPTFLSVFSSFLKQQEDFQMA